MFLVPESSRAFPMQMLSESTEHWNWTLYLSLDLDACTYITIHRHHCACNANVSSCWAWRWGWGVTEHGGCAAAGWNTSFTSQKGSSSVRWQGWVILSGHCDVGVSVAGVTPGWAIPRFSCGPLHLDSTTFDLKQVCFIPSFSLCVTQQRSFLFCSVPSDTVSRW